MTSTPFFRLVKLEWLAGELRVCQTSGNKANIQMGEMELSLTFTYAASYRGLSHLPHYFLHCSNFRYIPNTQPIRWIYKKLDYMQKTQTVIWKYVGGLQIVKNNLQKWLYSPSILKLENFSKDSVFIIYETKMCPIFRDFFI